MTLKLLLVSGTRADFGLWRPVLDEVGRRSDRASARVLVTAMHLDPRFGSTVDEVRRSGVEIAAEVACTPGGDGLDDMSAALGEAIVGMTPVIAREAPDWLLLLGDRGEQLAAGIAGLHLGVAVAHLHGGERTLGAVDDTLRDLISRIAHLHFVATRDAADRLRAMGESDWRVRLVGAPGLDLLRAEAEGPIDELRNRHGLGRDPYLLLLQHPETVGGRSASNDVAATIAATARSGLPVLAIGSNADAGGRAIGRRLEEAAGDRFRVVPSLTRRDFATLLAGAAALVGNSSSGLIEAPLMRVPAVNVGDRQAGRTRGDNVIDVAPDADAILAAIRTATDPRFRDGLSGRSPYGDGGAAPRIVEALLAQPIDRNLLVKAAADR
jgi:UDP-hydrolysing UDP-N-acetyl-D-glucosamine 2-epimerase